MVTGPRLLILTPSNADETWTSTAGRSGDDDDTYDRSAHTFHWHYGGWCCVLDRDECYFVWWGGWGDTDCTNFPDYENSDESLREGLNGVRDGGGDGHSDGDGDLQ